MLQSPTVVDHQAARLFTKLIMVILLMSVQLDAHAIKWCMWITDAVGAMERVCDLEAEGV